jgi:hypothetical protein
VENINSKDLYAINLDGKFNYNFLPNKRVANLTSPDAAYEWTRSRDESVWKYCVSARSHPIDICSN